MNEQEVKRVKQFLYSIRRTEQAIKNLEQAIEDLDRRSNSPPTWTSNPSAFPVRGGEPTDKLQSWAEFKETYTARRSFLADSLYRQRRKLEQYRETLESMRGESELGDMAVRLIEHKYYRQVRPDRAIWSIYLFCSKPTFYRVNDKALQFFFDCLPDRFAS